MNTKIIIIAVIIVVAVAGLWMWATKGAPSDVPTTSGEEIIDTTENTGPNDEGAAGVGVDVNVNPQLFNITASNFEFSQKEIRVKEGDTVTITLANGGGNHDIKIDEFNVATKILKTSGETDSITFVASKKGEFEYYCSIGTHRQMGMVGKLIVE